MSNTKPLTVACSRRVRSFLTDDLKKKRTEHIDFPFDYIGKVLK